MKTKLIIAFALLTGSAFAANIVCYKLSTGEITSAVPHGHTLNASPGEGTLTISDAGYAGLIASNVWPTPFIVSNNVFRAMTVAEVSDRRAKQEADLDNERLLKACELVTNQRINAIITRIIQINPASSNSLNAAMLTGPELRQAIMDEYKTLPSTTPP